MNFHVGEREEGKKEGKGGREREGREVRREERRKNKKMIEEKMR